MKLTVLERRVHGGRVDAAGSRHVDEQKPRAEGSRLKLQAEKRSENSESFKTSKPAPVTLLQQGHTA